MAVVQSAKGKTCERLVQLDGSRRYRGNVEEWGERGAYAHHAGLLMQTECSWAAKGVTHNRVEVVLLRVLAGDNEAGLSGNNFPQTP